MLNSLHCKNNSPLADRWMDRCRVKVLVITFYQYWLIGLLWLVYHQNCFTAIVCRWKMSTDLTFEELALLSQDKKLLSKLLGMNSDSWDKLNSWRNYVHLRISCIIKGFFPHLYPVPLGLPCQDISEQMVTPGFQMPRCLTGTKCTGWVCRTPNHFWQNVVFSLVWPYH